MATPQIIAHPRIVDNPLSAPNPRRYTREQARIGGIRSGAPRRFLARHVHAEIVRLNRLGVHKRTIAHRVGRALSTVYDVLSGKIRRCLTAAESALLGPWKPRRQSRPLTHSGELTIRNPSILIDSNNKGKQRDYPRTQQVTDGLPCYCGFVRPRRPQPCPVCGRRLYET